MSTRTAPGAGSRRPARLQHLPVLLALGLPVSGLVQAGCARPGDPVSGVPPVPGAPAVSAAFRFDDVQPASGLDFPIHYAAGTEPGIRETIGHPAALLDADGDGLLDVLLGKRDRVTLFRNRGGWKFTPVENAGFRQAGWWQGAAIGDFNNDGRPDVFLSGYGCAALYENLGGGRFRDITTRSGLENRDPNSWQTGAACADVDGDGALDLYVTRYVSLGDHLGLCAYPSGVTTACSPLEFPPQRGELFRNLGGGRFQEVTAAFGLGQAHGNGLGVLLADLTGDRRPELYLANDQLPCDLYVNRDGRRFEERGLASGAAFGADGAPQAGMGVDLGDYDGDGREDLVVTNYQREPTSVYRCEAPALFTNTAFATHIGGATTDGVGWGAKWADLDNDGDLDLALANGHPLHRIRNMDPASQPAQRFQLFANRGDGTFAEERRVGPNLPRALCGRALCLGDLDNDGRLDLVLPDLDGSPLLLRNASGAGRHWLRVRLHSRRSAEGARVTVRVGRRRQVRRCTTGGSFLSAHDPRVHFGLDAAVRVDELRVEWPGGSTSVLSNLGTDREWTVRE